MSGKTRTITKRKSILKFTALAAGLVVVALVLSNLPQAEEPVLGSGYHTANLNIEGMT